MIRNTYKNFSIGLMIFLLLLLSACSSNSNEHTSNKKEEETGNLVKHELGETAVPENPERVVTLELGLTEAVVSLGVIPIGVADDDRPERIAKGIFEQIEGYSSVGTRAQPSLEVIRTLNPDLIIADVDRHEAIYQELSNIAPTVAVKDDTADYETVVNTLKIIGQALGKEEKSEKLLSEHDTAVNDLKNSIKLTDQSVLQASYDSESNLFDVPTSSYFTPSFFTSLGINYALQNDTETSQEMTIEQLLQINPDILIMTFNEDEKPGSELLKDDKLWNKLSAVQNGKVYDRNHNDWSRRRSITSLEDRMTDFTEIFVTNEQ